MSRRKWTAEEIAEWRKQHTVFIYFNREDSNFLVPKSYGFGRTFNWANPFAWLIGLLILALIVWKIFFSHGA